MKEKISELIKVFTRVVTTIFIIASVYLYIFWGTQKVFSVIDIFGILIIGFVSAICIIPFMSEKEYSKKALLALNILYFLELNIASLVIGFILKWFCFEVISSVVLFELVIIAVYVIVSVINYKIDLNEANEMNKKLNSIVDDMKK